MICTTIQNRTAGQIVEALEHCGMAEIRLDRCSLSAKEIEDVFTSDVPLVATCRISEVMTSEPSLQDPSLTDQSREVKAMQIAERRLIKAVEAGARYVDVEIEAPKQMSKRVRQAAHENGTVFISHGDCLKDVEELQKILKDRYNAEVMIVTNVGAVIGSHSGPGTIALFFQGKNR